MQVFGLPSLVIRRAATPLRARRFDAGATIRRPRAGARIAGENGFQRKVRTSMRQPQTAPETSAHSTRTPLSNTPPDMQRLMDRLKVFLRTKHFERAWCQERHRFKNTKF